MNHSLPRRLSMKTMFAYSSSGPAQLALALWIDATAYETHALRHYQEFKRRFVAGWNDSWRITATEIRAFVDTQERQDSTRPFAPV